MCSVSLIELDSDALDAKAQNDNLRLVWKIENPKVAYCV